METLQWLLTHTYKTAKKLAWLFLAVFLFAVFVPKAYIDAIISRLAFGDIILPPPRLITPPSLKSIAYENDVLKRSGFATLVQSINLAPNQPIKEGDMVYGYARTDLFNKDNGTMWFVVRRADGAPVAYGRAYTQYNTYGFGFVPFSMRVPYLLISDSCLLEFRREDPATKLSDILFTSMPVTCVRTETTH